MTPEEAIRAIRFGLDPDPPSADDVLVEWFEGEGNDPYRAALHRDHAARYRHHFGANTDVQGVLL